MNYILTNVLAIAAATAAGLGIGALYAILIGVRRRRPGPRMISVGLVLLAVVAEFWLCCILAGALILAPPQAAGPWTMALASAVVIWIGFVLPTLLVTNGFDRLPARTGLANAAHWLAVMLTQAAVLQAIGLVRPG